MCYETTWPDRSDGLVDFAGPFGLRVVGRSFAKTWAGPIKYQIPPETIMYYTTIPM